MPQMQSRDINFGSCPAKNAFAPSMKSSTEVPSSSFEFYVRSEEGINLYVDLNSSPSEWTTRLKEGVCISQNVQNKNSHCLHQELGHFGDINKQTNHSFLWNTDSSHGINDGHVQTRPSPSSIMIENGHVGFDRPDGGDESLRSLAIKPCSISADMLGHSEEDHTLLFSSRPSSEVQDPMISGTESYPRVEGTLTLDSDVSDTPQIKSACDSAVILTFDGVKSFDTLDHQNSKVSNSIFEKSSLQMTCSLAIPSMVYPGCSASGSLKMQLSEVTSPHKDILSPTCENGGFLDLDDPMNNVERENGGLANSSKLSDGTHGNNPPTSAEEWERSDHIDRKENSECSQFNSTEKICLRSDDSESSEGLQKKRQHNDDENSNSCGKPDAKRSMKNHTGEVHPRRSMRLVSK
ncbi:hypothetical protein L1049_016024 [Liquidambar formosana]|uniref:Uncharacterized protein n=1 Tax=Liquidambar formosana TaxID=63359 RepID=A0AAP0X072_LIQFO